MLIAEGEKNSLFFVLFGFVINHYKNGKYNDDDDRFVAKFVMQIFQIQLYYVSDILL